MCGINGIISGNADLKRKIIPLNGMLKHRGPDDEGFVTIDTSGGPSVEYSGDGSQTGIKQKFPHISTADFENFDAVLGHTRLSIIDLTENARGPMCDQQRNIWIAYNGEIYNYLELREELIACGFKFRTDSDTEVIINAYLNWGEDCLGHFNGMWAFALWDARREHFFLARDRFGVKPLYYTFFDGTFAFSSEIKPLVYLSGNFTINQPRIPYFIMFGNRLGLEETYVQDIYSLRPAYCLTFRKGKVTARRYYDIEKKDQENKSNKELETELVNLLSDSIRLRFRSDVPVGTCLSGGFDSSSIVSLSTSILGKGIDTFSAVWKDEEWDESKYIDIVNSRFGCTPNKIEPAAVEFEKVFDDLSYFQEIPNEGPGLFPQWYVMKKAGAKVKVLLDGQGGDEVFGGYYFMGTYLRSLIKDKKISTIVKEFRSYLSFLNRNGINSFSSWLFPKVYDRVVRKLLSEKYRIMNRDLLKTIKKGGLEHDIEPPKKFGSYLNNLSYHFITQFTIPTLLHYEDRSSMAHSVESRVPFLDYRLVEFGVNLPPDQIAFKNTSRPLFKNALKDYLPDEIVERKDKLGYPTPFKKWSRTSLKPLILDTFSDGNSEIFNYIDRDTLTGNLRAHFDSEIDYSWEIWRLMSLVSFLKLEKRINERVKIN